MDPRELAYYEAALAAGCPRDQIANFARAGIVLQPRQLAASAAARLCDAKGGPTKIGYGGARGGGKSHWAIAQVIADDCTRFPGLKFLYLRKVGKAGREAVQDLRREVLHSVPHEYRAQANTIALPNGSRVVLGHFQCEKDIDNYLGLQYDGALVEEATQLTQRKVRDIGTCVRSAKRGWRPRMYFTTNPGNVGHGWFKRLFIAPLRAGRERLTRFVQATVRDNAFVNAEYREELEGLTGWQRRAWLDGDWDIAAGQYFTNFVRGVHCPGPIAIGPEWRVWLSYDYGFVHNGVVTLMAQDTDGSLHAIDQSGGRGWLTQRHAKAVDAMLARHGIDPWRIEKFVAGHDCWSKQRDGGSIAEDWAAQGWTLERADIDRVNGAAAILRRLGDHEAGIPPRLFFSDACGALLETLPALEHDKNRPEDVRKVNSDDDGLGGDDWYDSLRYAVMVAEGRDRRPREAADPHADWRG